MKILIGGVVYWVTFHYDFYPQWIGIIALLCLFHVVLQDFLFDGANSTTADSVQKIARDLADRLGESKADRLTRQIENKPSDMDELVRLGELLDEEDREWLAANLKMATEKHRS